MGNADPKASTTGGDAPSRLVPPPNLSLLPRDRLEEMHDAAAIALECQSVLQKSGMSVISEVLRGQGDFVIWERYPKGDIFDAETHSHYFYHSHTPDEMTEGENGHFHIFVRPEGIMPDLKPWDLPGATVPVEPGARFVHLGALSVDAFGNPIRLFTTNRWVTDETFYRAEDVIALIGSFRIGLAHPNWAVNQWLNAMVTLYRPQLEALLRRRDEVIVDWAARHSDADVLEDRRLQNTSETVVDMAAQIAAIEAALGL
jgi:hypothetical protein